MDNTGKAWQCWQRISSAPKDGTVILLHCKSKGPYVGKWDDKYNEWIPANIPMEECEECSGWVPNPTYWCEIPKRFHM